jgi:hypothetical protein
MRRGEIMLNLRASIIGIFGLLLLVNICSADVDLTITPVNGNSVAPGGTISYYVNVNTNDLGDLLQKEIFFIREDTKQSGWEYTFDPASLLLTGIGETRTLLTIKVPSNTEPGSYQHILSADGLAIFGGEDPTIQEPIEILVESDETAFNTDVQIPEFPSVAVPVIAILGLVTIFGRRKSGL